MIKPYVQLEPEPKQPEPAAFHYVPRAMSLDSGLASVSCILCGKTITGDDLDSADPEEPAHVPCAINQ